MSGRENCDRKSQATADNQPLPKQSTCPLNGGGEVDGCAETDLQVTGSWCRRSGSAVGHDLIGRGAGA